jgi:hypothetical protein
MKRVRAQRSSEAKVPPKGQALCGPKTRIVNGLVVFDLPENCKPVTSEQVKKLEAREL